MNLPQQRYVVTRDGAGHIVELDVSQTPKHHPFRPFETVVGLVQGTTNYLQKIRIHGNGSTNGHTTKHHPPKANTMGSCGVTLHHLEELEISTCPELRQLDILHHARSMPRLQKLSLSNCRIGTAFLTTLLEHWKDHLEEVVLHNVRFEPVPPP